MIGRTSPTGGRRRPLVAMLTSGPLIDLCEKQWLGAVDAARAGDADLVCFDGFEIEHPDEQKSRANSLFDLVDRHRVDALAVWTTRLGLMVGDTKLAEWLRRFDGIPLVSVEQVLGDYSAILMDNRGGMRKAVDHLIEGHGYRRIAFVRGPENHLGAHERYQGYLDALAEHGIEFEPALVTKSPSRWNWDPSAAADSISELLQGLDELPQAVAAANDDYAIGVISVLEGMKVAVPADVAVVGYDDHTNIQSHNLGYEEMTPETTTSGVLRKVNVNAGTVGLTTVHAPFYELGYAAVQTALSLIRGSAPNGSQAPVAASIPTEIVVRRSCGCFAAARPQHRAAEPAAPALSAVSPATFDVVVREALGASAVNLPFDWPARLRAALVQELAGTPGAFVALLDTYVRASMRGGGHPDDWWRTADVIRKVVRSECSNDDDSSKIAAIDASLEESWPRVQMLLAEANGRWWDYRHLLEDKRNQTLRASGQRLISAHDIDELGNGLAKELSRLGIPSVAMCLPSRSLACVDGACRDLPDADAFPHTTLRPTWRDDTEPWSAVVLALQSNEEDFGYAFVEVGPRLGWVYESLREHLSGALRGALMVQRERRAVAVAEDVRRRLEAAHAELELRVEERTRELAAANEILTEQMRERELAEHRQASLETQLRHAQKMEAIGRLAGGIAHDFNNLLVVINGYSDMLLTSMAATDPNRADLLDIRHAGERAANLTRQLLAFSRQQVMHPRRLDLNSTVAHVEVMLQRLIGEDIQLSTRLAPDLVPVWADAGQVEQIVLNLAVNARDAMPVGGMLRIETANATLDADVADAADVKPGRYAQLRVVDTGIGMDEATRVRAFEPFFTTKPPGKGTGLGLATVFGIVQQTGGHIDLASERGVGTTISVYFPQAIGELEEVTAISVPPEMGGTETLLLVEDDHGVRATLRRFLVRYGYRVLEAADGATALRVAYEHGGPIHLVVTDVIMPGMSGPELVDQLQRVRPGVPTLFVSGYSETSTVHESISGGFGTLLEKPFTAELLAERVRALLDDAR